MPLVVLAGLFGSGCGGADRASLEKDVRLEIAHDPPGNAPAGEPFLLGMRISATPPLGPGSAHVWYETLDAGWSRLELTGLAGTDRLEAEIPPQPRGTTLRYYFTVRSALGEMVRLPSEQPSEGASALAPPAYEIEARAPVASWAMWLRTGGAALALALVVLGGVLSSRRMRRTSESAALSPGVALVALGLVVFAVALGGAVVASWQATGDALRDVPGTWWIALLLWSFLMAATRRSREAGAEGTPWLARLVLLLTGAGGLAVLAGLTGLP